jgi:DNA-directed RNA polymerase specialized sigma24 family protein
MDFGDSDQLRTDDGFAALMRLFGDDPQSNGVGYLAMRRRLVVYFDRKNADFPEDLADETLSRVARRLTEEGGIEGEPARFCYITARFVLQEWLRASARKTEAGDDLLEKLPAQSADDYDQRERRLNCLEKCVASLNSANRNLITNYYLGERRAKIERRSELAAQLGISSNALMIRASRIRSQLEECVRKCLEPK